MIEELALVEGVDGRSVTVRTQRQSACSSCSANKGCGTRLLNQLSEDGQRWVATVSSATLKVNVGDTVVIGLDEAALTQGSAMVYGLPLLAMLMMAALASGAGLSEGLTALCAMAGMAGGLGAARYVSSRLANQSKFQPQLLRRVIPLSAG